MSRRFFVAILFVAGAVAAAGVFLWDDFRGALPAIAPPEGDIAREIREGGQNNTNFPLKVEQGFSVSVFAEGLPDARVIRKGPLDNYWVSQPDEGKVTLLTVEEGEVTSQEAIFEGLDRPHGLAFDPDDPFLLYIAEEDGISQVRTYTEGSLERIAELPAGGRHWTRTIGFGPDGRLYVSIGSSCDTCVEEDERRAAILRMNKDGSGQEVFAEGLRNAVFFDWHPNTGEMWATEMGRDFLGDHLPPDEVNIVKEGKHYGWPYCYGDRVRDEKFEGGTREAFCEQTEPAHINITLAHSAPLGLSFIPEEGWGEEYAGDLLVAFHGSWNRTEPVGYKVVRYELEGSGVNGKKDFVAGWLTEGGRSRGRPVDVLAESGGVAYVTDDKAGLVYKIEQKDI